MHSVAKKFKRSSGSTAIESENPYLSARKTWNDYTGSIVASRGLWQIVGILSLLIVLISVGGMIHIGSQSKFIPYVIEVDKVGNAVAAGPIPGATQTDSRVFKYKIAEFITDARLVTPDASLQRAAIFRLYASLSPNDPATQKMNEWLNGNTETNPFNRARKMMVSIEIKSLMPQTPDTWQIDWIETARDRNGGLVDEANSYRALVTVYTAAPSANTTEEQLRLNPLGVYIRDFSWQKLL